MFQCDRGYSMIEPGPSGATCVAGRAGMSGAAEEQFVWLGLLARNYQIFSIGFHYRSLVATTTTEVEIFQQEKLFIYFYKLWYSGVLKALIPSS